MIGDQADGLRRLLMWNNHDVDVSSSAGDHWPRSSGARAVTLAVAAREGDVIDAYVTIKRTAREQRCRHFRIAITDARSDEEARTVFDNMRRVAQEHLGVRLEYIGMASAPAAKDSVL